MEFTKETLDRIKTTAKTIRAINHPLRQRIMDLVRDKEMAVTDIYVKLRIGQSIASQHLKILRDAKAVTQRREAKYIFYSINLPYLKRLDQKMDELTCL